MTVRLVVFGIATSILVLSPTLGRAADVFRGRLRCEAIPNYTKGPLDVEFLISVEGEQLAYQRRQLDQVGAATNLVESGTGTLIAGHVTLTGGASGATWQYRSSYSGTVQGNLMGLTGVQAWQGRGIPGTFNRKCSVSLSR